MHASIITNQQYSIADKTFLIWICEQRMNGFSGRVPCVAMHFFFFFFFFSVPFPALFVQKVIKRTPAKKAWKNHSHCHYGKIKKHIFVIRPSTCRIASFLLLICKDSLAGLLLFARVAQVMFTVM
ncbi:hypothetical protein BCR41DRAFT_133265 [Lobosporangium transversale]|uniref:Uncharacterized protein n=1 Tax=Lobosporangium transversale TaxID=64571 RepID=A0A1Y2GHV9_9FUNG|nr:hypothetical protein BCR41DRAFT_133265 [Lobosporangium transversale]ORZ10051.1 hypothetical protein BCR41DRAFT_133265 [Lobosporangium transversale]|eukprot:XP_021879141.1 hypothetical protein BCR41DRAFT_133265 [Lobosporangium transversale]